MYPAYYYLLFWIFRIIKRPVFKVKRHFTIANFGLFVCKDEIHFLIIFLNFRRFSGKHEKIRFISLYIALFKLCVVQFKMYRKCPCMRTYPEGIMLKGFR